ncbi:hypothetical protein [Frankia sp. AgB32]|uniref:hypothetical protein n=1 Tax=Frankia sp. AgB32 TaxID=631119 RepID=UPI00200FCC22|nr:hypothetical protein [Frankia sp. AgB32]MCK9898373.1 hypothetical protein [Frankia sp. AgB32]
MIQICDQDTCVLSAPHLITCPDARVFVRACGTHHSLAVRLMKKLHPGKRITVHSDYLGTVEGKLRRTQYSSVAEQTALER